MASVTLANLTIGAFAHKLIEDPDKHLGHLKGHRLVFVKERGWSGDKELTFGRASMKSHLQAVALDGRLVEGDEIQCDNSEKVFLFEVNQTIWDALEDDPEGEELRLQGLYHLMLHCAVTDKGLPKGAKPDIQLFTSEIYAFGDRHRRVQALLKRVAAAKSGKGAGMFADVVLDADQGSLVKIIADRIENPTRQKLDGKSQGVVIVGEGESKEYYLPTHFAVENKGAGVRQRFYHAVKLRQEAEGEAAPELPFDKRFASPGMRLVSTEGEGADAVKTVYRVAEIGYRLLLPLDEDRELAIDGGGEPGASDATGETPAPGAVAIAMEKAVEEKEKKTRRRKASAAAGMVDETPKPTEKLVHLDEGDEEEAPAGLLEALRDRALLTVGEAERYFVSRYTMNEALRAVGISPTGEMAGLVRAQGYPYAIFCSTEIGGHPVVQAYRVMARDHFAGQTKEYAPADGPRHGMLLALVTAEERYEYVIVGEEIYQLELAEVAKDAPVSEPLELHPDAAERITNL